MFNEIDYVTLTIQRAVSIFDLLRVDYEIIVVDDASNDGSEKIIDELSFFNNRINVIHLLRRKQLGAVLRKGFLHAKKDFIIYTDMDMPFDLSKLKDIISDIDGIDIVHSYRIGGRRSLRRIIYSKCYNFLIRTIFDIKVKDVNFAMKIFKRNILNKLDLKSEGSFINAEFLIKATYSNYKIAEIPIKYLPRKFGRSKLSSPRVVLKIICEIIKLYSNISSLKANYKRDIKD